MSTTTTQNKGDKMTNTTKHTATPWKMQTHFVAYNGNKQGAWLSNEDYAFARRAVNSHEELLDTLKKVAFHVNGDCAHEDIEECNQVVLKIVNQAIANAEK
jgi:hypothetical protein